MEKLIYRSEALSWQEALPLGNGHTGLMIYGGKERDTLAFNDCTLWSGYPKNQNNPESLLYLDQVRQLVFEGKNAQADALCMDKLCGGYSESFLPLGELKLAFSKQAYTAYRRELDIGQAIHRVSFESVTREAFCSHPDKLTVYRVTSAFPFDLEISAASRLRHEVRVDEDKALMLLGRAPDHVVPDYVKDEANPIRYDEGKGMSFCLRCELDTDGQKVWGNDSVSIRGAREVTLYIATSTGFLGYDKFPSTDMEFASERCAKTLSVIERDYETLKGRHTRDYTGIYGRQSLRLYTGDEREVKDLLEIARQGLPCPGLCELIYNYGKYLMISASRQGGQAMNLQGIWNDSPRPPWSSNYTVNINTQMNYWGMSRSNLADCAEPYVRLVREVMERGRETARVNLGCEGFCCNHNVDIWRKTSPVRGEPSYMYAPLCGAWLSNELYSHYKNGGLEGYKDDVLEIARQTAMFLDSYLVMRDGYYVTAPSASPEASFLHHGGVAHLDYATGFEMCVARQAFSNYLEFATDALAERVREKMDKLYPISKGETGILEWHDSLTISEKGHRHFSPLYGFYPAQVIAYHRDKEETRWAEELFAFRTDHATQFIGWAAAWAICLCGRLHDANKAGEVIKSMLANAVFDNLFSVHPPFLFQIDGNLGFIAAINELLLYEEDGVIDLLPALPEGFDSGEARGMVVNGMELSFRWEKGLVTGVESSGLVKIRKAKLSPHFAPGDHIRLVEGEACGF